MKEYLRTLLVCLLIGTGFAFIDVGLDKWYKRPHQHPHVVFYSQSPIYFSTNLWDKFGWVEWSGGTNQMYSNRVELTATWFVLDPDSVP